MNFWFNKYQKDTNISARLSYLLHVHSSKVNNSFCYRKLLNS